MIVTQFRELHKLIHWCNARHKRHINLDAALLPSLITLVDTLRIGSVAVAKTSLEKGHSRKRPAPQRIFIPFRAEVKHILS